MPLDVLRLRDSDLSALSTGEEFKAAVLLWCVSWHQVPAGSIPNDERWLAKHSGAGRDWKKVRTEAMRGWIACSDGRLYHPVVAEKAREAWHKKQEQRIKTIKARIALTEKRIKEATTDAEKQHQQTLLQTLQQTLSQTLSATVTESVTKTVTASKGIEGTEKGQGQGQGQGLTLTPPAPPNGGNGKRRVRRVTTAPPDSFDVTDEMAQWAVSLGLPAERVLFETEKCMDHFRGEGRGKADWMATWRNWIRKAVEFGARR
jgi:hypothetical protein